MSAKLATNTIGTHARLTRDIFDWYNRDGATVGYGEENAIFKICYLYKDETYI